ncbi:putative ABC transporter permease [Faecalimonas sp.]
MKKISEYLFMWALGGTLYYTFEVFFRGFSHWTMFVLGGICVVFCVWQGMTVKWKDPLWIQILRCTIFVVSSEFITGIIVNKWFKWYVWDYTDQPFQLFGQICVPFAIIFSGLCALSIIGGGFFLYWFYGEEKPDFHVL